MALSLFSLTKTTPLSDSGAIVPGGLLNFYATGYATRKDTYADADGGTVNDNPVELDGAGRADIFLDDDGGYDVVFTDPDGNEIWSLINVVSATSAGTGLLVAPVTDTVTTAGVQAALPTPVGRGDLILFCNNATLLTIRGIDAGYDGQSLFIYSIGAGQIDLVNQSTGASAPDRIINQVTASISLAAGVGRVQLVYDETAARWRVLEHEQGDWIVVPFSAGNFTASGSMTWTVASGDVKAFAYYLRGRILEVVVTIETSTVAGTPDTQLLVAMPGVAGALFTIAARSDGAFPFLDNSVAGTGQWACVSTLPTKIIFAVSPAGTTWTASTDATAIYATLRARVA